MNTVLCLLLTTIASLLITLTMAKPWDDQNNVKYRQPLIDPDFLIWYFQNGQMVHASGHENLRTRASYVIAKKENNDNGRDWDIRYWVGENSNEEDRCNAANYAILVDSKVHSNVMVHREVEKSESPYFKAQMMPPARTEDVKKIHPYDNRMFLITGDAQLYLLEVMFEMKYVFENENHCVICVFHTVYTYCEESATEKQKRGAQELASIMLQRRRKLASEQVNINLCRPLSNTPVLEKLKYNQLLIDLGNVVKYHSKSTRNELYYYSRTLKKKYARNNPLYYKYYQFTPDEMRRILAETIINPEGRELFVSTYDVIPDTHRRYLLSKEYIYLYIYPMDTKATIFSKLSQVHRVVEGDIRVSTIEYQETQKLKYERDMPLEVLNTRDSYIIDTQSQLGVFVWIGKDTNMENRLKTAIRAEQYLSDMQYDCSINLRFINQEDITPEITTVDEMVETISRQKSDTIKISV